MLYVKNLHKSYQSGNKSYSVLKGINLSVADQEFVAVMGLPAPEKAHCSIVFPAISLLNREPSL